MSGGLGGIRRPGGPGDTSKASEATEASRAAPAPAPAENAEDSTGASAAESRPATAAEALWSAFGSDPGVAAFLVKLTESSEFKALELREIEGNRETTTTYESGALEGPLVRDMQPEKMEVEDGKFTAYRDFEYRSNATRVNRETTYRVGEPADEELAKRLEEKGKRLELINMGLGVAAEMLGLKKEIKGKREAKAEAALDRFEYRSADGKTEASGFIGARATATREGEASIGIDGLKAKGKLDARAGLYEEIAGKKTGDFGTVEGSAVVKAEAYATAEGSAKIDLTGAEVTGKVGVGVEVSAEVKGKYTTPPLTKIGGQDITASVEARGKASLEAKAEAEGKIAITRIPPQAIIEGKAGASAVAKLEGDVTLGAGPFSVKAEGYVSAGAEAQASGAIGYSDGKLKLNFGAGAALGVGAGGKVAVEVDLKQLAAIGKGVLDADKDGKLTLKDTKGIVDLGAAGYKAQLDLAAKGAKALGIDEDLVDAGAKAAKTVVDGGAAVAKKAIDVGAEAVDTAIEVGSKAVDVAVDTAKEVGSAIADGASDAYEGAKDTLSKGVSFIKSLW